MRLSNGRYGAILPVVLASLVAGGLEPQGREDSHRVIVFVADNCDTPPPGPNEIAPVLTYFVDRRMAAGDLVSIVPVAEGTSSEQQLTDDRALLRDAIAHTALMERTSAAVEYVPGRLGRDRQPLFHGLASFEAVSSAVDGLALLPGRKSVVLLSRALGWPPGKRSGLLRDLADRAQRAGVTIYSLDPGTPANPSIGYPHPLPESGSGPGYLARETGGLSFTNNSYEAMNGYPRRLDPDTGLMVSPAHEEWLEGSVGYLEASLDKVLVHAQNDSRNGSYRPPPETQPEPLSAAARSPFAGGDLPVRMVPFVSATDKDPRSGKRRPTLRAVAAIDPRHLRFENQPDGSAKATVDLLAEARGPVEEVTRSAGTCAMTLPAHGLPEVVSRSLLCGLDLTPGEPGSYVVRIAARDQASGAFGSAYALVAVPDFNRSHIITSTLELTRAAGDAQEPSLQSRAVAPAPPSPPSPLPPAPSGANQVERVFAPGGAIRYECEILGARLDRAEHLPHIQVQVNLFRPGFAFSWIGPRQRLRPGGPGPRQLAAGRIRLPSDAAPGHYYIELTAIDTLGGKPESDYELGSQEMDFWVVEPKPPDAPPPLRPRP